MATSVSSSKASPPKANTVKDGNFRSLNSVEIQFFKSGTVPPVFVAASFSSPPWAAFEMTAKSNEPQIVGSDKPALKEYRFSKVFDEVPNGIHHYKFRLGVGDWWTTAEDQKTATDEHGNKNNVLNVGIIKPEQPKEGAPPPSEPRAVDAKYTVSSPSTQSSETNTGPKSASVPPDSVPAEKKTTLGDAMRSATASAATAMTQIPAAATAMTSIAPKKIDDQPARPAVPGPSDKASPRSEMQDPLQSSPPSHASEAQFPLKDAAKSAITSITKLASETPLPASPAPKVHGAGEKHENSLHLGHHHASPSPPASRRLADTAAEVADTASMLDRSGTSTPASKKAVDHTKLSAEEEHARKHMVRTLTQFRSRVDVLLDDAHDKGLMAHDVDHMTENEPGHFPMDDAIDAASMRRRTTGANTNRSRGDAKPVPTETGSSQQTNDNAFPWNSGAEIFAGLLGGLVGTVLALLLMWVFFGHR